LAGQLAFHSLLESNSIYGEHYAINETTEEPLKFSNSARDGTSQNQSQTKQVEMGLQQEQTGHSYTDTATATTTVSVPGLSDKAQMNPRQNTMAAVESS